MSLIPEYEFSKCVKRYRGDRHAIKFNCRDQFLVMSFAQFSDELCSVHRQSWSGGFSVGLVWTVGGGHWKCH